jgi:hypothetical protein
MGEKFEEVENLKRGGGLARDQPFSGFGNTLRSGGSDVSTARVQAREGRGAEGRPTDRGKRDPEET